MGNVQNNLVKVILRLDFQDILEVKADTLKEIRGLVKTSGFADVATETVNEVEFRHNFDSLAVLPPKVLSKKEVHVFSWNDDEGSNIAMFKVSSLFVLFEYNQPKKYYSSFDSTKYKTLFYDIVNLINRKENNSLTPTRLGFRKINDFFFSDINALKKAIIFNFIPALDIGINFADEYLIHGNRVEYNNDANTRIILQSRMESGIVEKDGAPISVHRYLYDIDAYAHQELTVETLPNITNGLSVILRGIYEKSINFDAYEGIV